MTIGPIDFLALEFKGNQFKGEILPALLDLINSETIRLIDLVIVMKDEQGKISMRELQQTDTLGVNLFDPHKAETSGMIKVADLEMIGGQIENNTTAAVMLFENLWAVKFTQTLENANARLVMFERIPHQVVLESLEDLTTADQSVE